MESEKLSQKNKIELDKPKRLEEMPFVLCIEDIMKILSIGRNSAYALVRSGQIRSIRIGKCYRIPRDAVLNFLEKV